MSRSRSGDKHRRRISRSYSRSPRRRKNRSRSRSRKRSGETPLITAKMSNKIFIEEKDYIKINKKFRGRIYPIKMEIKRGIKRISARREM